MKDVAFSIDRATPGTLAGKVVGELRRRIADGTLRPGDRLPSRVSTAECFRGLRKHNCRVIPVTLGVDSRETAYLAPLAEALKSAPDFVFIRTCGSRQSLVCRMVADAGVPYATITLGAAPRTPGRCCGTIRLEKDSAIGKMVGDSASAAPSCDP